MTWTPPTNFAAEEEVASDKLNDEHVGNLLHIFALIGSEAAWTSYTPSDSNITVGNGTRTASYLKMGRTVFFRWRLVFGTTTALSALAASVGLPAAAAIGQVGAATYQDTGSGVHIGLVAISGSLGVLQQDDPTSGGGAVTSSLPFSWTTGDIITVTGMYESAS